MRRRRTAVPALLLVLAAAPACREGVPTYLPPARESDAPPPRQLTFSYGQDRDPVWLPDGSAVLYHAEEYARMPFVRGALLSIPVQGGVAEPLFPDLQTVGGRQLLATPVLSPDGRRVAYMDLLSVRPGRFCFDPREAPKPCPVLEPLLDSIALRVRELGSSGPVQADPSVGIKLAGIDPRSHTSLSSPFFPTLFPFQDVYHTEQAMLFRPSWAPDGERLVYSDGLRLLVWRVGSGAGVPIPNSADGVSPAWSTDGAWIAFTRMQRIDSTSVSCTCPTDNPRAPDTEVRKSYTAVPRIALIRPDGSGLVELGRGEEPAWSPDGRHLYIRREDRIVRVELAGGAERVIPGTAFGRAPAISRDGRWLAFARRKDFDKLDYDIWVIDLTQN